MARRVESGADGASNWLRVLRLLELARWHADIVVPCDADTWFELAIDQDGWGFSFRRGERSSSIRVTETRAARERDDFDLLARTPELLAIPELIGMLEREHGIRFRRDATTIRTNVPGAPECTHDWLHGQLGVPPQPRGARMMDQRT